jgi:hypothetical protein
MMKSTGALLLLIMLLASPAAPIAAAPATARHSGAVVFIDAERGVMIVDEVGPWRVENERTVITRLRIDLTRETLFNTFVRINAPGRFAGEFLEVALDATDVTPGDIVTIDCRHEGDRLVAKVVTIAAMD